MICIFGSHKRAYVIFSVRGQMEGQLRTCKIKRVPEHLIGVFYELGHAARNFYRLYLRIVSYRTNSFPFI